MLLFFCFLAVAQTQNINWNRDAHALQEHLNFLQTSAVCPISELLQIHIFSRYDVYPEDPDLFERAARMLQQCDAQQEWEQVLGQDFGVYLVEALIRQQQRNYNHDVDVVVALDNWLEGQDDQIASQISKAAVRHYRQSPTNWILSLQSEQGGFVEDYAHVCRGKFSENWVNHPILGQIFQGYPKVSIEAIHIPILQPGQYQDVPIPTFSDISIQKQKTSFQMRLGFSVLLCMLWILVFVFRRKTPRVVAILGGGCFLLTLEILFSMMGIPNMAMKSPLFSFTDWQFMPFEKRELDGVLYWESQGGAMRSNRFAIQKSTTEKRIAVLGASSAHGSNHLKEEAFAGLLESRWQKESQSEQRFVWNLGIGGTTSNGVLFMGLWALEQDIDGLIIYYGHNEAAQFSQIPHMTSIPYFVLQSQMYLSQSRIYYILRSFLKGSSQALVHVPTIDNTNRDINSEKELQLRDLACLNLRYNIHQLIDHAKQKQVPVLLINPTYNFRFAPTNPFDDQSDIYRKKAEILSQNGDFTQARFLYKKAIESGSGITTITESIRETIEQISREQEVYYVDAEEIFYTKSKDGLSANGLFWDELHPSRLGHVYLADVIWDFVQVIERDTDFE